MSDYASSPVTMRIIPGVGLVQQDKCFAKIGDQLACVIVTASEVLANPEHFFRKTYPTAFRALQTGAAAAFVLATINGKPAQIKLTQAEFDLGAVERERYAAWLSGAVAHNAEREAAERAYDQGMNEGGEGFNPHRSGSERTYGQAPRRERDYPDNAKRRNR